jgi:hypothetical protein
VHYPVAILCCVYNNTSIMTIEYTTTQVARACGLTNKMYLLRLVWSGKLPEPRVVQLGGIKFRFWSEEDRARAVELVAQLRAGMGMKGKVPAGLARGSQD